MNWLPDLYVTMKFVVFFSLGFENARYILALRAPTAEIDTDAGTGPLWRAFIGATSWVHVLLMLLFFALHWYDFGFTKTLILYGTTIFVIGPLLGRAFAKVDYYFRESYWGGASILIYPSATWLALNFSWFGYFPLL